MLGVPYCMFFFFKYTLYWPNRFVLLSLHTTFYLYHSLYGGGGNIYILHVCVVHSYFLRDLILSCYTNNCGIIVDVVFSICYMNNCGIIVDVVFSITSWLLSTCTELVTLKTIDEQDWRLPCTCTLSMYIIYRELETILDTLVTLSKNKVLLL